MTRPPLEVRADLADLEPYVSPQLPAKFRMNTNESPYSPPREVVEAVVAGISSAELNRYPDRDASRLRAALARQGSWSADGVWAANGSNEVLLHLFLAYGGPGRTALVFEPTYSLHSLIPRITGTRVRALWRDEDYNVGLDDALAELDRAPCQIVVLCSPNNPTGNVEPLDTVRALAQATDGIVVVDEAYGEFAEPGDSVRPLLDEYRNIVLVKTFSKAWSLAGVRLGYMLADPSLVEGLARVRLPYHLSTPTQIAGEAMLAHAYRTLDAVEAVIEERDRLAVELQAMGVKTFPSRANFVLFQVDGARRVWQALLDQGVLVRDYSEVPGLLNCLRVTAGLPEETDAFLQALREALDA